MKIYTISGLGADIKSFEFLELNPDVELVELPWLEPLKSESIEGYARRMAAPIDAKKDFILMGYSFGGIIAQEICEFLKPKKLILISTIVHENEKPNFMRWGRKTKAHRWLPYSFFTNHKVLSYTFFRKLYDPHLPQLSRYFTHTSHSYLKWSVKNITRWEKKSTFEGEILRLHGSRDIVFPSKKIKKAQFIPKGTHLMLLQRAKKISKEINDFVTEK